MNIIQTDIPDVLLIEPRVFGDERGCFFESFNLRSFENAGLPINFVQDNISRSSKHVLRGLHYQIEQTQGKLVTVLEGQVLDVAVDLRKDSATFGKYVSTILSAEQPKFFWVPPGFAHGFLVTSAWATFFYKVTDYYAPQAERTILWNDPTLAIDWQLGAGEMPILSEKDSQGEHFLNAEIYPYGWQC